VADYLRLKISNYCRYWYHAALFLCLALPCAVISAAEWDVEPSIFLAASYNDNIFLSPRGREQSDYVRQINPALLLEGQGRRANIALDAVMQNVFYSTHSDFNDTFWNLNALGDAELISEFFFIDATAGKTQQIISREARIPADNLTISANRTNLNIASISPYIRTQIGRELIGELRYRGIWTDNEDVALVDTREQSVYAELSNSPSAVGRAQWGFVYDYRLIEPDTELDSRLEIAVFDLDYELTGKVGLLAGVGYENNKYDEIDGVIIQKGPVWFVGMRWDSSPRNSLSVRIGERAFGNTMSFDWARSTRRWTWNIGYIEQPNTRGGVLISNQEAGDVGDPIVRPGDPLPTGQVFLDKRFDLGANYDYGKSRFELGVYHRDRNYQAITIENEVLYGGIAEYLWRWQPRTELTFVAEYQNEDVLSGTAVDKLFITGVTIDHQVIRDIDLGLNYRYFQRDSTDPARTDYKQNQVTLGLDLLF
jgi:hypothetical protein